MLCIAHRGASVDAPENTLEAFRLAVEQRADMIETDLHLTRNGAVALVHDAEIAGAQVGDLTLSELRGRLPDLPTLDEALDAVGAEIPFNLELKRRGDDRSDYADLEGVALDAVTARGWLERTLFSSFFDPVLERLRKRSPAARIGLLISSRSAFAIPERAERLGAEAVHLAREVTSEGRVAELHRAGYLVHVFTVDDPDDQRRLAGWGVDGIFTNTPARLREALSR